MYKNIWTTEYLLLSLHQEKTTKGLHRYENDLHHIRPPDAGTQSRRLHYIKCMGEANSFEVEHNGYVAFVNDMPEYRDAIDGSYEGREFEHIAELVSEEVKVDAVYNADGDAECPEIKETLQVILN